MEGLFVFYLLITMKYLEKLFLSFFQWNLRKQYDILTILQNLRRAWRSVLYIHCEGTAENQQLILQSVAFQSCIYSDTSHCPANQWGLKRDSVELKTTPLSEIWSLVLIMPSRQMRSSFILNNFIFYILVDNSQCTIHPTVSFLGSSAFILEENKGLKRKGR